MASTFTTETRSTTRDRHNPVPLLLSSFPVPPSHIPASPFTPLNTPLSAPASTCSASSLNPPPSLPPSSPLPPVPGPSPVTEHDTLMFITAARSRRASKLSIASSSSYSRRNSTATLASNVSGSSSLPSLSSSVSVTPVESSTRSLRSYSSNGSLSVPTSHRYLDKSPMLEPRICEEEPADLNRMSLDEIPMHSPLPDNDLSDDEKVLQLGIPLARSSYHSGNDTISSIDMCDLPPLHEDEPEILSSLQPLTSSRSANVTRMLPNPYDRMPRHLDKDLPPLPSEPPTSTLASSVLQRADSPDIQTILATTPRPRRKSSGSCMSGRSRSPSRSRSRPARATLRRHVSEGIPSTRSKSRKAIETARRTSEAALPLPQRRGRAGSQSELPYASNGDPWNEDSFISDYGQLLDATGTPIEIFDGDEEQLERELEGEDSDTDSSLDIHTPLPNLMLRDGLLSPNSKLLPRGSGTGTPQPPNERPGSLMSIASSVGSVMTKSGLYKDERDTMKRRVRHRDGKLLRGGIGLTTGLGWSDSEDEDAPSPLTRQLSSNSLSRKSMPSSLGTSRPFSRSFSAASITTHSSDNFDMERFSGDKARSSFPLTTSRGMVTTSTSIGRRVSSSSAASSSYGVAPRASVSSLRSTSSSGRQPSSTIAMLTHINEREEPGFDSSSGSSSSFPMPVTPITPEIPASSSGAMKDRMRSIRKTPSVLDLQFQSHSTPQSGPVRIPSTRAPFSRSTSVGSTVSVTSSEPPVPSSPATRPARVPRPLRLPQHQGGLRRAPDGSYRPTLSTSSNGSAGSTKSLDRIRTQSGDLQRPLPSVRSPAPTSSPSVPASRSPLAPTASPSGYDIRHPQLNPVNAETKQKPRTGTGMTYRTSSNSAPRASMMRMPSSTRLRTPSNNEVGIAI